MNQSQTTRAVIVAVVIILSIIGIWPTIQVARLDDAKRAQATSDEALKQKIEGWEDRAIRRGLDLAGGVYMELEIDDTGKDAEKLKENLDEVTKILRNRVDMFGVSEPDIRSAGSNRIIVQLPGLPDLKRAKELIGTTARLELHLLSQAPDMDQLLERLDDFHVSDGDTPDLGFEDEGAEVPDLGFDENEVAAAADSSAVEALDTAVDATPETFGLAFSQYVYGSQNPLYVKVEDRPRVKAMLETEGSSDLLMGRSFMFGMEDLQTEDWGTVRPLYLVENDIVLSGENLERAYHSPDPDRPGKFRVNFTLDTEGSYLFASHTEANVGRLLAITLDGQVKSAPRIDSRIPDGNAVITGQFDAMQASDLALLLRAGALPVDLNELTTVYVGPSLGQDSIRQGINSALYGLIIVVFFILIYYRLTGFVVVLALVVNLLILMATLAQFNLVLTLPGIAGIILTIGMAVDANVLINERIREELRRGKTARAAVDSGYANATRTIVDANVTTLIAAMILWWFGSGPVRGFAVTLTIGIFSSMFTALVLTRVIMETVTRNRAHAKLSI